MGLSIFPVQRRKVRDFPHSKLSNEPRDPNEDRKHRSPQDNEGTYPIPRFGTLKNLKKTKDLDLQPKKL